MNGNGLQLNIYEQFGYIAVGYTTLFLLRLTGFYAGANWDIVSSLGTFEATVAAYVLGNIIQALANLVIKEKKGNFTVEELKVLATAAKKFDLDKDKVGNLFSACHLYVLGQPSSGHVLTFNAMYGMYRGWLLVVIWQVALTAALLLSGQITYKEGFLLFLLWSLLSYVLFKRMVRFGKYFREKVLLEFLVLNKNN